MNATRRVIEQLGSWADLASAPAPCGTGTALRGAGQDIIHLHTEHDADLHLTTEVVERLRPHLEQSTALRLHSGSAWVTLHLDCTGDADLLLALASLALQAHSARRVDSPDADPLCNLARIDILHPTAVPAAAATTARTARVFHLPRPRSHRRTA